MKKTKNILAVVVLLVGLFGFKKADTNPILLKNLDKEKIVKMLSAQEFGCRPSSDLNFYVETILLKKYRGFVKIEAKVFFLDKRSNQKRMLVSENIIVANHKESFLNFDKLRVTDNSETTELENGHIIIHEKKNAAFKLENLLSHELIYNRYIISTNKLLKV